MNLNDIRAVVTGGQSGLGLACVQALQEQGAKVVAWDLKPQDHPYEIYCDVSQENSVKIAIDQTIEKIGIPNVCIQCAGIAPAKRIIGKQGPHPLQDFSKVIEINLIGSFNVMRLLSEQMLKLPLETNQTRGLFILTASVAAMEGQIGQAAYSASKGGVAAMTLPAARELAQHHIRVNTIAPGLMATPMMNAMPDEVKVELAAHIPFPKRLGYAQEYAALALHIIQNDYINGEMIRLDAALRMT
jgi:NAD(P)-dependent dehydrogenase (short-subunit alcohol dehydrogenase family)